LKTHSIKDNGTEQGKTHRHITKQYKNTQQKARIKLIVKQTQWHIAKPG